jgi:5-oxoprolinase (ATP-hydrolysing) subunit C
MSAIRLKEVGPLTTLQDGGRPGCLAYGISASGPMDRAGFDRAGLWLGQCGSTGIELTSVLAFQVVGGPIAVAFDGGAFTLRVNGAPMGWPGRLVLKAGDDVDVRPGPRGNWAYLRFGSEVIDGPTLGSRSTNSIAGLGRILAAGDEVEFAAPLLGKPGPHPAAAETRDGPIRIIWGLHAETFDRTVRQRFIDSGFRVSARMDRMGTRLDDPAGVFAGQRHLSLVSDAIVPGDIQILGDGTPIVLMRDHQPTGGYPRIATVLSADIDRLAQTRPGTEIRFAPVTLQHARGLK